LFYTNLDKQNIDEYEVYFETARKYVENFFSEQFNTEFDIYIYSSKPGIIRQYLAKRPE